MGTVCCNNTPINQDAQLEPIIKQTSPCKCSHLF